MFILQSSHSAIDPWRQIYNNIQMLVKLYIKMFMLNNRIKAEERKVLILIFMLTFKIKVIFLRIQDELSHTLKEQIILDIEVKCKFLNRMDITCPSLSEWVNVSCLVMSNSLEKWTVAQEASLSMEFSREE